MRIWPPIGVAAGAFGKLIQTAMALQPFWMGIAVSVLVGIALMLLGLDAHASAIFWMGAGLLVLGNLAARICCELVMMFIILCRKTVSASTN